MSQAVIIGNLTLLLAACATLAIAAGGALVMVQAKRPAALALRAGTGLAVAAGVLQRCITATPAMAALGVFVVLCALAGIVAIVRRKPGLGFVLLWPACARWIVWPMAVSYLPATETSLILLAVGPPAVAGLLWVFAKRRPSPEPGPRDDRVAD